MAVTFSEWFKTINWTPRYVSQVLSAGQWCNSPLGEAKSFRGAVARAKSAARKFKHVVNGGQWRVVDAVSGAVLSEGSHQEGTGSDQQGAEAPAASGPARRRW